MSSVFYSPEAESDLLGIAEYIARDKPEAARSWIHKIRVVCQALAMQPTLGEVRTEFGVSGCRSFSVGHYVIFFRPKEEGIEVARIIHGSRDLRSL
ncbi:MAG: type II toxin-antitoxin system RelE/ParE family toxin [Pirellulaceae bacterium]|jgi:toxin ParE1/3/4